MTKKNYQLDTDAVIAELGGECPRLLLQCCCAPCSSYVLEYLCRHFDVSVLFYNPNIYPQAEYEKRLHYMRGLLESFGTGTQLLYCDYEPERFEAACAELGNEPEGGLRCTSCFRLRLEETAKRAAFGGFDYFTTTLTVSPHKDAVRINEIGFELADKYVVKWLPADFKKREGYKRSIELSEKYGLYRQDYCGCRFSFY